MNNRVCIYHANCDDGFGAAWVVNRKFPGTFFIEGKYGDTNFENILNACKGKEVFIVDFSYKPEQMVQIAKVASKVIWYDHHKTAIEAWGQYGAIGDIYPTNMYSILDMTRSGIGITWGALFPNKPHPWIVKYIQDNDLWKFEYASTRQFITGLRSLRRDFAVWDELIDEDNVDKLCAAGMHIQRYTDNKVRELIDMNAIPCMIEGFSGWFANCTYEHTSVLCNELAKLPQSEFGCSYYVNGKDQFIFSLRSIGALDVSAIARQKGGGGHKNAAGFTLDFDAGIAFIKEINVPF